MSILDKNFNLFAKSPTEFPINEYLPEPIVGADFSFVGEFDVQQTADTENEFPAIAQGYPAGSIRNSVQRKFR